MNKHKFIVNSHARIQTEFTHGKGMHLFDGKIKYLDFMSGIAVNSLGHCHKKIVKALTKQAKKLWHISNLFYNSEMDYCAETLCRATGMQNVFFCNSGSEAMETSIKMARKFFQDQGEYKYEIITCQNSFHGRSITNISASGEAAYTKSFYPLLEGFKRVEYGNIEELKNAITEKTAAVIIEPIQGEGVLNFAGWDYLQKVSQITKESGVLFILDEVQCGAGRTGRFNAFQWANIQPDIIAMAKGIGNGFPVGATLFSERTKNVITVGSHGTTFGGNPLAMAVVNATCTEISNPKFLANVQEQSVYIKEKLNTLHQAFPHIVKEIRGFGLMTGFMIQEKYNAKTIADALFTNKLIVTTARNNVIRLLPPLIVEKKHIDDAMEVIVKVFQSL